MALNYQILGKKIQQIRVAKKIPQVRFAELINMSTPFLSRIERGVKGPSLETLVIIADALEVSLDALLAESRSFSTGTQVDELSGILDGCNPYERYLLVQNMKELKAILREAKRIVR